MADKTWLKVAALCVFFLFFLFYALEADSLARVGGGMSSGSRGSRSFSIPGGSSSGFGSSQSYPPGGGFGRGMAGGIVGGLLGGMLFRGLGFGGGGGLFPLILLALILYVVYRFVRRRREGTAQNAYYQSSPADAPSYQPSYEPDHSPARTGAADLQTGLRHIRQMDPSFDEARFQDASMDMFFKIQGAWTVRDMSTVRNLLTDEMYRTIQGDAERLKAEKKINKLDNIAVRTTDIIEAWQESGRDYMTVRFYANLVDYTVDESSGQVVTGSRTDPVKFEEYWTFTRPVGNNGWQLSAINQPQ